jgi:hypothetical protein
MLPAGTYVAPALDEVSVTAAEVLPTVRLENSSGLAMFRSVSSDPQLPRLSMLITQYCGRK